jgi:nitrogen fixation protein NifU and related proteins
MDLYQELILEHSKRPHGAGLREPFDAEVHHLNPTCGDEITLRVAVDAQAGVLTDVSYAAQGCAISRASTSVLHDLVAGAGLDEVARTTSAMRAMLTSRGADPGDEEVLGDGIALTGVAKYPARVKCALLGWMALREALARADGVDRLDGGPDAPAASEATTEKEKAS